MKTLNDFYNEYAEHYKLTCDNEPLCYGEWLNSNFVDMLNNISCEDKCHLYNEYAENSHKVLWDYIDTLNDWGDNFLHVYSMINHSRFNELEDIIIEENFKIVSYTFESFVDEYWNATDVARFIHSFGLENLNNNDVVYKALGEV